MGEHKNIPGIMNKENISQQDMYKIYLKSRGNIERMELPDEKEMQFIKDIKDGRKRHFKQIVCSVRIKDKKTILSNYNELLSKYEEFRTYYLYKGLKTTVKIICKHESKDKVPITDLRNLDIDEELFIIKNVLAREYRREYDPERDMPIRFQFFLIKGNKIIVMASYYEAASRPFNIKTLIFNIFGDMEFLNSDTAVLISKTHIRNITAGLIARSEKYWEKMAPFDNELKIPGEITRTKVDWDKKGVLYKPLEKDMYERLEQYCERNSVPERTVIMEAWGELIGLYNNTDKPVLAVSAHGENMNIFPVRIDMGVDMKDRLQNITGQLDNMTVNSDCSGEYLEKLIGKNIEDYFHAVYSFIEFQDNGGFDDAPGMFYSFDGGQDNISRMGLQICGHLLGQEIGIGYTYQSERYQEVTIERLHQAFLMHLDYIITGSKKKIDKYNYLSDTDTDSEKLRKLEIAQYALYIKESGRFPNCSAAEYMSVSEQVSLKSYIGSDIAIEQGQPLCELGILVEGHMEESVAGMDGIIKSIRLIGPGGIIGIEGILENNKSHFTYSGVGENVKILWFDRDILISFLNGNPDNWRSFLEYAVDDSVRIKSLWTME